ncbi:hypothetical protein GIW70_08120 [Pseudomonas syringae]|nr:hypothetical protein [Pseudomonas syringae]MCF5068163.1 hypothetical protein [Pseudomonas syringae]
MLRWPKFNTPFEPTLSYWLGGISVFDREETLGAALWVYDPNDSDDREKIICGFILSRFNSLSYRHKFKLVEILEDALSLQHFDFSLLFKSDDDAYEFLAWDETEIHDPRGFFQDVYKLASITWASDLYKAGLEDQSIW